MTVFDDEFEEAPAHNGEAADAYGRSKPVTIYALIDPLTHQVRYIGKTTVGLRIRFTAHMRDKRSSWKTNWIRSLKERGLTPEIEGLELVSGSPSSEEWQEAEMFWISYMRSIGCSLTNLTDGGEGLHGHRFSDEHKRKIGQAHKGRIVSDEARAKMRESRKLVSHEHLIRLAESQRGKPLSDEHKAKLGKAWLGRKHTPETRAKMSASAMGRKVSEEGRKNMSIAQKNRTKEHQEKISAAKRGKPYSEQARKNMSLAQIGRKHSEETIRKMIETRKRNNGSRN